MIQQVLIGSLFLAALLYLGRLMYRSFQSKGGCASGCGKCSAVDFDKIAIEISKKKTAL